MGLLEIVNSKVSEIAIRRVDAFIDEVKKELESQGHVNTGKLRDSIRREVERFPNLIQLTVFMADYGFAIDGGIKPSNIPYSENRGNGGRSAYIEGLKDYFISKGLQEKEALGAAFGTANKHKLEGMPTKASFRFSSNGKRKGFFTDPANKLIAELNVLQSETSDAIILTVGEVFRRRQRTFEKLLIAS